MKKIIIAAMILLTGCGDSITGEYKNNPTNEYKGRAYEVVGISHPSNIYCEYVLKGWGCPTIVDSIGKYHIGQQITLP